MPSSRKESVKFRTRKIAPYTMKPTAAAPISQDPQRRSASIFAARPRSSVTVAIVLATSSSPRTSAVAPRLRPVVDAMGSPSGTSIRTSGGVVPSSEMDAIGTQDRTKEAFQQLVRNELPGLYSLARRLVRDGAEDLVQETLLLGYRSYAGLEHEAAAGGWLRTIMVNVFRDHLRKRAR